MYQLSNSLSRRKSQPRSETSLNKFFSNPIPNQSLHNMRRRSEQSTTTFENLHLNTQATLNNKSRSRHSSSKNLFGEAKQKISREKCHSGQKRKSYSKFDIPSNKDALRNLDTNGFKTKKIEDILRLKIDKSQQKVKKQFIDESQLRKIIEKTAAHSRKIEHTVDIILQRAQTQVMNDERLMTMQSQLSNKRQKKFSSIQTVNLTIRPHPLPKNNLIVSKNDQTIESCQTQVTKQVIQDKKGANKKHKKQENMQKEQYRLKKEQQIEEQKQKIREQEKKRKYMQQKQIIIREQEKKRKEIEEKQKIKEEEKKRKEMQEKQRKIKQQKDRQQKKQEQQNDKKASKPPKIDYFNQNKEMSEDDSLFDCIQNISLSPESKITPRKGHQQETKNKHKKQIQVPKKNQKDKQKEREIEKQQKQKQIQKTKALQKKEKQKKEQQKAKQKQMKQKQDKETKKKQQITSKIQQANKIIDLMTPVGEVAGYCSQVLKKSKLSWHTPATLLYKQCYHKFKSFEDIYKTAADNKLISEEEKNRYLQDNQIIYANLCKIINMAKKKNKIKPEYQQIITDEKGQDLFKFIQKQVLAFAEQMKNHEEGGYPQPQKCLLRMINGVLILANLKGRDVEPINNIDELKDSVVSAKIKEKMKVIEKIKLGK